MNFTGGTGGNLRGNATGSQFREKRPHGYQFGGVQQFTPEQLDFFSQLMGLLGPQSQSQRLAMGDQSAFEQLEAPAMRQFQQLQGQIASRFSGQGLGGRRGSGFNNAINQATQDFASSLQANRMGIQRQALADLQGFGQALLQQRPYERFLTPKKQNNTAQMIGQLGGALPGLIASFAGFGSPASALQGGLQSFGGYQGGGALSNQQLGSLLGGY